MELINGRTAEEIKTALRWAAHDCNEMTCGECSFEATCRNCDESAIADDALALIERLEAAQPRWISGSCLPRERGEVLVIARGKPKENIQLLDAYELAEYAPGEGWIFEAYPEWENGEVRWWMPLPEEPEEGEA